MKVLKLILKLSSYSLLFFFAQSIYTSDNLEPLTFTEKEIVEVDYERIADNLSRSIIDHPKVILTKVNDVSLYSSLIETLSWYFTSNSESNFIRSQSHSQPLKTVKVKIQIDQQTPFLCSIDFHSSGVAEIYHCTQEGQKKAHSALALNLKSGVNKFIYNSGIAYNF